MERIVYRKTLDVHKNGIQFTLQGFETADKLSRRIEISLAGSGDTIDIPLEQITAMVYVTTPSATEPSINECTIKDNKIIYDVLPITEEGITEMQLKLIETRVDGAKGVLATPRFSVEVTKSNLDDGGAENSVTYTALENAIAKANGVYESRLIRIELSSDCMFRAFYADGTTYETDVLKELFLKGDALLSESFARGGTGVRAGEDTDNSMYYSNVSRSAAEESKNASADANEILAEVTKQGVYTAFSVDFTTGEVEYVSPSYKFVIDEESGELNAIGETYTFEETVREVVSEWLISNGANIDEIEEMVAGHTLAIDGLTTLVESHSDDISKLYGDVAGVKATADKNKDDIVTLNGQVAIHNEKVSALETAIETNKIDIAGHTKLINENKTSIEGLRCETKTIYLMEGTNTPKAGLTYYRQGNVCCIAGKPTIVPNYPEGSYEESRTFWFAEKDLSGNYNKLTFTTPILYDFVNIKVISNYDMMGIISPYAATFSNSELTIDHLPNSDVIRWEMSLNLFFMSID